MKMPCVFTTVWPTPVVDVGMLNKAFPNGKAIACVLESSCLMYVEAQTALWQLLECLGSVLRIKSHVLCTAQSNVVFSDTFVFSFI